MPKRPCGETGRLPVGRPAVCLRGGRMPSRDFGALQFPFGKLKIRDKFLIYNRLNAPIHEHPRRLHERGNRIHERVFILFCPVWLWINSREKLYLQTDIFAKHAEDGTHTPHTCLPAPAAGVAGMAGHRRRRTRGGSRYLGIRLPPLHHT